MIAIAEGENGGNFDIKMELEYIPRNTLEYLAATYTNLDSEEIYSSSEDRLVEALENVGAMGTAWQIYKEAEESVARACGEFDYFCDDKFSLRRPVTCDQVIDAIDNNHAFGKAVFMLMLEMGSMEIGDSVYYADKKQ